MIRAFALSRGNRLFNARRLCVRAVLRGRRIFRYCLSSHLRVGFSAEKALWGILEGRPDYGGNWRNPSRSGFAT
jgi:hypothetical protein